MNIIFENKEYGDIYNKSVVKKFKEDYPDPKCVAVCMKRSPDLLFLMYYLFKNGITYIPIDPMYPYERIQYILNDSKPDIVIFDSAENSNYESVYGINPSSKSFDEDISYILYTSGSTGKPKGIKVTREALLNFIEGISEIIDFSHGRRIACLTTISFDIFFLESIMALDKGLTVVLANEDEQRNPKLMAKLIQDNAVEMIQMTPSRMQLLLNYDKELSCLKGVKDIMLGGEPFPISLLHTLQEKTTAKIYNMYGPTETTIWSTVSDLTHAESVNIGRPIKNTEIYIIDENLSILTEGQSGEICIAGKGLAKGYVGRDDLTVEKFCYLPQKPGIRVYRTGDIGRYLPDGNLEYLGRADNQVKIRGHRIELEEIESHLNQFEGIKQSIVLAVETSEKEKILEAYYTSDTDIEPKCLSDFLSLKLPSYMIPTNFWRVENFILTPNGKIDRKRVSECVQNKMDYTVSQASVYSGLSDIQKKVLEMIVSNIEPKFANNITPETELTSIGINSISYIKLIIALENEFNFEFDDEVHDITELPTIKSMMKYVESKVVT